MPCFFPVPTYRCRRTDVLSHNPHAFPDPILGKRKCWYCLGCRLDRSRGWGIRCMHEAGEYELNSFLTLTYDDANLEKVRHSLSLEEITGFLHRYRKVVWRKHKRRFRFYYCGEYGEERKRPHYHVLIFGHRPDDLVRLPRKGLPLFKSDEVFSAWKRGFVSVGDVTYESAAYCAQYVSKKRYGKDADAFYKSLGLVPEFSHQSKQAGGLGYRWIMRHMSEVYSSDEVILRGKPMRPPPYYDRIFERVDAEGYAKLKDDRIVQAEDLEILRASNELRTMRQKLSDIQLITEARYRTLSRLYESGGSSYVA